MAAPQQIHFLTPRSTHAEAPLFVFSPGMDGTGELLRTQTEGLERAFDVRCIAIPPDDLTNWETLTDQAVALVRTELEGNRERKVYLCGESFGGCLALKMILRSPGLFHRLILVNPASSFNRRPWIHWGSQVTKYLPEPLYQASCIGLMPFLASLGRITIDDRQALLKAMQSVTQTSSIWRLSLLSDFKLREEELASIQQPVLLIVSKGDRLLPSVSEAQLLSQNLPKAHVHVLPNSGHACLLESDINLYEILRFYNFLDQQVDDKVNDPAPATLSASNG